MAGHARLSSPGPRARSPIVPNDPPTDPQVVGVPVRTCVGCRKRDPRSVLLRLVVDRTGGPRDIPVVDVERSLPGRGAWLHASLRCLDLAERRRAVPRALRVAGPLDLSGVRAVVEELDAGQAPSRPGIVPGRTAQDVD